MAFDEEILAIAQKGLGQFVGQYQAYTDFRNSMGVKKPDTDKFDYGLQIVSGWFVRQFENEYNPLHIHTGSRLSCVGYLKLPEGIEEGVGRGLQRSSSCKWTYTVCTWNISRIYSYQLCCKTKSR